MACSRVPSSALVLSDRDRYLATSAQDANRSVSSSAAARAMAVNVAIAKQDGSLEAKLAKSLLRLEHSLEAESSPLNML